MRRVPGAAQREAISAFTRVFDALWRNGALQSFETVAVPDQWFTASQGLRAAPHPRHDKEK